MRHFARFVNRSSIGDVKGPAQAGSMGHGLSAAARSVRGLAGCWRRLLLALGSVSILAACGGGGDVASEATLQGPTERTLATGGRDLFSSGAAPARLDLNGDGKADLLWYSAASGQTTAWLMNGTAVIGGDVLLTDPNFKAIGAPDLNGDGKSDLLWYNAATGQTVVWLMNGLAPTATAVLLTDANFKVIGMPDLNRDGRTDLLWYNAATGQTTAWLMNGTSNIGGALLLTDPNFKIVGTADLNGDGSSDLLWYNAATGQTTAWLMNGTTVIGGGLLLTDPNFKIVGTADLNGDGKSDLLWYGAASGQTTTWLMDGMSIIGGGLLLTDPNFKIVATADLNGDGKLDLLWYSAASGQTTTWLMNGTTVIGGGLLLTDPNFKIVGTTDLSGDSKSDLLWYNAATGQTTAWLMNGTSIVGGGLLLTDPNFRPATLSSPGNATPATSRLYIGYYIEDAANNPEDPTDGMVSFKAPSSDGSFSGQMPFSYIGCSSVGTNVGGINGNRSGNALKGNWRGTVDGTSVGGSFSGTYSAAADAFSGGYINAAGKTLVQGAGCSYYTAAFGTWRAFGSTTSEPPSFSLSASASAQPAFGWTSLGSLALYRVRVFDYACLELDPSNIACFFGEAFTMQTGISYPAAFPSAKPLVPGGKYLLIVTGQNASTGAHLGFTTTIF